MSKVGKILVVLVICLLLTQSVFAVNILTLTDSVVLPSPIEVINTYRTDETITYSITSQKTLKSMAGNDDYTFYALAPFGYAILYNGTNGLMEACYTFDATIPIDTNTHLSYYYGGPGVYCIQKNGLLFDVLNNSFISDDDLTIALESENSVHQFERNKFEHVENSQQATRASTSSTVTYTVESSYFYNLVNYGNNVDGTCTVIAIQMLLGYYDVYVNNNFVANTYRYGTGTTESFHTLLNSYVYGSDPLGGIYIRDAVAGINSYLRSRNLNCNLFAVYSSQNAAIQRIITTVTNGQPIVASMGKGYDAPYNHTVLVYRVAYSPADPVGTAVFTVHMGWSSSSSHQFVASASWFYECGFINSSCSSHTLTAWRSLNATSHIRNCQYCTYTVKESHSGYWDAINGRCTRCGYTGPSVAD